MIAPHASGIVRSIVVPMGKQYLMHVAKSHRNCILDLPFFPT